MKRIALLPLTAAAGLLLMGFDLETSVRLQRDLAGTAEIRMSADFEPVLDVLLTHIPHNEGQATRREVIEKLSADLAAKLDEDQAAVRAQLEKSLPAGVTLLANTMAHDGVRVKEGCSLRFDDARKLAQILLPEGRNLLSSANPPVDGTPPAANGSTAEGGSVPAVDVQPYVDFYRRPFPDFQVTDEGAAFRISLMVSNPVAFAMQNLGSQAPAAVITQVENVYRNSRFRFELTSPFDVIETNATSRAGQTLIWDIDLSDPNAKLKQQLTARFKR